MTVRPVLEGRAPSNFASVRRARAMLRNGPNALQLIADDLRDALSGEPDLLFDRPSRLLYATDASLYEMEPVAVVFPRTPADAAAAVAVARSHGVPVLPRGGGTSLAGQGVNHAVVLDFTRHMNRVLAIDPERRRARVQPGLVLSELNKAAREYGLHYPIDPSTANRATIGGGIGNNSCGTHSGLYGKTVDVVDSMDVILSDGAEFAFRRREGRDLAALIDAGGREGRLYRDLRALADRERAQIAERFPDIPRRVSGYNLDTLLNPDGVNLSQLVVGSEGTLAVVTEATVQLAPLPARRGILAAHFRTLVEAAEATVAANLHRPAAIELVDEIIIERCRSSVGYAPLAEFVVGDPGAILLIECFAHTDAELRDQLQTIAAELEARGMGYASVIETDPGAQARMWQMRQAGLGLLMSMHGDPKPVAFVEDTAVPPERLPQFVARFDAAVRARGLRAGYYGHAAAGCLHIRPVVNVKDPDGLDQTEQLAAEIADLVVEFGGSLSGEHGDGIVRGAFMEKMFGPRLVDAFRETKRIFDPDGLLNPGKIIDTPPFRDNLRLSPETQNLTPPSARQWLNFDSEGGLARAAELCNGQGACRKFDGGMCPSFQVTQDEEHSTRGRANLLRQILNGALPAEELSGDRLHEALDLCVECKACKAECPSGVDLAKLKYEVLAHRRAQHGTPLRDRAFAAIATLARYGSATAPLSNALAAWTPARAALHRLGIHRKRPLPRFARRTFARQFRERQGRAEQASATRGEVLFFDDTFTNYVHPEVGIAAIEIIEALGYRPLRIEQRECCGRPAISKGLLDDARELAQRNVEALVAYAREGVPIVGTEPSCLLSLRDEYPLLLRSEDAAAVASQAMLFDEWLATELARPDVPRIFSNSEPERPLQVHVHCHQKALAGFGQTLAVLRAAGYEPELIDSGCCGMAGSFGFEAEHYELSRQMGELRLFPALRATPAETPVAITGVSCRQQIGHFAEREARHLVEYLAEALKRAEAVR